MLFRPPAQYSGFIQFPTRLRSPYALAALAIAPIADRDPERLSGGQAQLVALAGVLALRPAYLVLDEPTSQLDPQGTHLVADAIDELIAQTGAGVLVAEHKTDLLQRISGRLAVVVEGSIAAQGDARRNSGGFSSAS